MGNGTTEERDLVPRLLIFSGKQVDWRMWSRKFLARSNMRKYFEVLIGTLKTPPEPDDGTVEFSKETKARLAKEEEVKIKNNIRYMELLMAITDEIQFCNC
jgi:hypothetical protein